MVELLAVDVLRACTLLLSFKLGAVLLVHVDLLVRVGTHAFRWSRRAWPEPPARLASTAKTLRTARRRPRRPDASARSTSLKVRQESNRSLRHSRADQSLFVRLRSFVSETSLTVQFQEPVTLLSRNVRMAATFAIVRSVSRFICFRQAPALLSELVSCPLGWRK